MCSTVSAEETKSAKPAERPVATGAQIEKLVGQLGANDYRTREDATRQLLAIGPPAAETLAKAAKSPDLEVSYRCVRILESLLNEDDEAVQVRAAAILESLTDKNSGAVADLAGDVLTLYRFSQQDRALEKLEKLGAVVVREANALPPGTFQVVIKSNSWTGKNSDLELLKQLPSLSWLRIIHIRLDDRLLSMLAELNPLQPDGDPKPVDKKRVQTKLIELDLYGTGISEPALEKLSAALPSVRIDKRNGALLGVVGHQGLPNCLVQQVMPGTAAAEADIRPGDEITMFDGVPIHSFEEFMSKVSTKQAGDNVKIDLRRGDKTLVKELTLSKWEE